MMMRMMRRGRGVAFGFFEFLISKYLLYGESRLLPCYWSLVPRLCSFNEFKRSNFNRIFHFKGIENHLSSTQNIENKMKKKGNERKEKKQNRCDDLLLWNEYTCDEEILNNKNAR